MQEVEEEEEMQEGAEADEDPFWYFNFLEYAIAKAFDNINIFTKLNMFSISNTFSATANTTSLE